MPPGWGRPWTRVMGGREGGREGGRPWVRRDERCAAGVLPPTALSSKVAVNTLAVSPHVRCNRTTKHSAPRWLEKAPPGLLEAKPYPPAAVPLLLRLPCGHPHHRAVGVVTCGGGWGWKTAGCGFEWGWRVGLTHGAEVRGWRCAITTPPFLLDQPPRSSRSRVISPEMVGWGRIQEHTQAAAAPWASAGAPSVWPPRLWSASAAQTPWRCPWRCPSPSTPPGWGCAGCRWAHHGLGTVHGGRLALEFSCARAWGVQARGGVHMWGTRRTQDCPCRCCGRRRSHAAHVPLQRAATALRAGPAGHPPLMPPLTPRVAPPVMNRACCVVVNARLCRTRPLAWGHRRSRAQPMCYSCPRPAAANREAPYVDAFTRSCWDWSQAHLPLLPPVSTKEQLCPSSLHAASSW